MKKFLICFCVIGSTVYGAKSGADADIAGLTVATAKMAVTDDESAAAGGAGAAKPAPTQYTLNRLADDGAFEARYTSAVPIGAHSLSLDRAPALERVNQAWHEWGIDGFSNHMFAGTVGLYRTEAGQLKTQYGAFKTKLFRTLIPAWPALPGDEESAKTVDWTSGDSDTDHTAALYRRKSDIGNYHSEPKWIEDYKAVWTRDSASIVRKFMPPVGSTMLMSGIELSSSLDACDACLDSLITFRAAAAHGQASLSAAIKAELTRRGIHFAPAPSEAFGLLLYHSKVPYSIDTTYHAHSDDATRQLIYEYGVGVPKRFSDVEDAPTPFVAGDTLVQHVSTALVADVIYGHIHNLTNRVMPYSAAHTAFRL